MNKKDIKIIKDLQLRFNNDFSEYEKEALRKCFVEIRAQTILNIFKLDNSKFTQELEDGITLINDKKSKILIFNK